MLFWCAARIKAKSFAVSSAVLAVGQCSIRPSILPRDNQEGCCSEERSSIAGAGFRLFDDPRIDNNAVFQTQPGCFNPSESYTKRISLSAALRWLTIGHRPNRPSPQKFLISSGKSTNY